MKKYNLSKAAFNEMMNRLDKVIAAENEKVEGLLEAQITTNFVKLMTKVKDLDDVIERNTELSAKYTGFLALYGFTSLYDMYIYAMSCELFPERVTKGKDYSKLVPVKRKIIRNGKETIVTVYEDPDKENKKRDKEDKDKQGREKVARGRHVRDMKTSTIDKKKAANPKNIAKIKAVSLKLPKGNKVFQDSSIAFLTVTDEKGDIVGVVGYSEDGSYLTMDFYRTNGEVSGVAAKGFFELLKLALKENKGVKVEDNPEARSVFLKSGLQQDGKGFWYIEAEELKKLLVRNSE